MHYRSDSTAVPFALKTSNFHIILTGPSSARCPSPSQLERKLQLWVLLGVENLPSSDYCTDITLLPLAKFL